MAMNLKGKRFLSAVETLPERTRKKLLEATSWYKERKKESSDIDDEKEQTKFFFNFDSWDKDRPNSNIIHPESNSAKGNWRK